MQDEKFRTRMKIARIHGWRIKSVKYGESSIVYPPEHFRCSVWACVMTTIRHKGRDLHIPEYFWNDDVLKYGTRFCDWEQPKEEHGPISSRTRSHNA